MSVHSISYHGLLLTVFEVIALFLNLGWWVTSGRCAAPPAIHQGFGPAISAALASIGLVYELIGAHVGVQPIKCPYSPAIDVNQSPRTRSYFHALDSTANCYWPQKLQGKAVLADCNMVVPFPVVTSFTAGFPDKPSSLLFLQSVEISNIAMRFGV